MAFRNSSQRKAAMARLTMGEKYFLHDCLKAYEQHGPTVGSRIMAQKLKKKVKYL